MNLCEPLWLLRGTWWNRYTTKNTKKIYVENVVCEILCETLWLLCGTLWNSYTTKNTKKIYVENVVCGILCETLWLLSGTWWNSYTTPPRRKTQRKFKRKILHVHSFVKLCESFVELGEIAIPLRHLGKHKENLREKYCMCNPLWNFVTPLWNFVE